MIVFTPFVTPNPKHVYFFVSLKMCIFDLLGRCVVYVMYVRCLSPASCKRGLFTKCTVSVIIDPELST